MLALLGRRLFARCVHGVLFASTGRISEGEKAFVLTMEYFFLLLRVIYRFGIWRRSVGDVEHGDQHVQNKSRRLKEIKINSFILFLSACSLT